jgi:UDP-N-acetylmuramyl tripeptide synthase
MKIKELFEKMSYVKSDGPLFHKLTGVQTDSRKVKESDIFVCLKNRKQKKKINNFGSFPSRLTGV